MTVHARLTDRPAIDCNRIVELVGGREAAATVSEAREAVQPLEARQ